MPSSQRLILCIDDETEIARILQVRLLRHGVEVASASNGRDGFTAALARNPDLIFLDLCMPDEDGEHVLERLRRDPRTSAIPVFFLTGADPATTRKRTRQFQPDDYLAKPLNFDELQAKIIARFPRK